MKLMLRNDNQFQLLLKHVSGDFLTKAISTSFDFKQVLFTLHFSVCVLHKRLVFKLWEHFLQNIPLFFDSHVSASDGHLRCYRARPFFGARKCNFETNTNCFTPRALIGCNSASWREICKVRARAFFLFVSPRELMCSDACQRNLHYASVEWSRGHVPSVFSTPQVLALLHHHDVILAPCFPHALRSLIFCNSSLLETFYFKI